MRVSPTVAYHGLLTAYVFASFNQSVSQSFTQSISQSTLYSPQTANGNGAEIVKQPRKRSAFPKSYSEASSGRSSMRQWRLQQLPRSHTYARTHSSERQRESERKICCWRHKNFDNLINNSKQQQQEPHPPRRTQRRLRLQSSWVPKFQLYQSVCVCVSVCVLCPYALNLAKNAVGKLNQIKSDRIILSIIYQT